jgi:REP element-mobilizing transposase RayT
MRKGHKEMFGEKLWGKKFWSAGYFYRTVGAVNAQTVERYIKEGQRKHWEEEPQKEQTTLYRYAA